MELQGKTIVFLGDSITEGHGVWNIPEHRYDNVLLREAGLAAVYNYGIGGTRLAHQAIPSEKPRHDLCFCARAYDLNPEADIIVVFGGTNDYDHGDAHFGAMTDTTPATFCGAVEFLMNFLPTAYPKARLVFLTPARRENDLSPSNHPNKGADARPLLEYVRVIVEKGQIHGIPVLNLYENLPIDPNQPADREKYTSDGLHLNDQGQVVLADTLLAFLQSL